MSTARCFSAPPPDVDLSRLSGHLVVVEGPDSSGRSTHVGLLSRWLEEQGFAVTEVGIKRSTLVATELEKAKAGNVMSPRTMSLFYATDFYDQYENVMLPALRAGSIVLADRYVFTLMARDLVRGDDPAWVESIYSRALVPDRVFFLKVPLPELAARALRSRHVLDYWESGMDLGLSRDWFESFGLYQQRLDVVFRQLGERHGFIDIDADRSRDGIQKEIRGKMTKFLAGLRGSASRRG